MIISPLLITLSLLAVAPQDAAATIETEANQLLSSGPGQSAFAFTELTSEGIKTLYGVRENESFAVGSSFKLFILGELIEEVNSDRRQLSDTMRLERLLEGPPFSEMAAWPQGMPVTLNTLALKMIWLSDNTATDHLHHLLGREAIEQRMQAMGHSHPEVNRPLLSTREMTMLRDKKKDLPGKAYQKLDEQGRRAFLAKFDQQMPNYESLDFDTASFEVAEWYASPLDMARALAWIKFHTEEASPAHTVRDVLTVDVKLPLDRKVWKFAGFKGGSEDQVLAGNWLLQHRNGKWYTFHVYFNNPDGPVKPEGVMPVMEKILKSIEPMLE